MGERIAVLVQAGELVRAYDLLAPVLAERTPFPVLGRIGGALGAGPMEPTSDFLDLIAVDKTEGGWVVIGAALGAQLDRDLDGALDRCRDFIFAADVWYGADILGERVPGPALLAYFQPALDFLDPWREDENRWVRPSASPFTSGPNARVVGQNTSPRRRRSWPSWSQCSGSGTWMPSRVSAGG